MSPDGPPRAGGDPAGRLRGRRALNARYRQGLADVDGIEFMPAAGYGRSNCWLTCVLLDETKLRADRESLREHLEKRDIESRPVWKPMHLQPVFAGCRVRGESVAEDLFRRGLCLPSGTGMSDEDIDEVIAHVRDWVAARTLGVGP